MTPQCNGNKKKLISFVYNLSEKLENKYLFISAISKSVCLICSASVAVSKECSVDS
jgi:hypothetical protein